MKFNKYIITSATTKNVFSLFVKGNVLAPQITKKDNEVFIINS